MSRKPISVDPNDTETIKRLVAEGTASIRSGNGIPAEEVFARLEAKYRAMAKAKKTKPKTSRR